MLPAADDGSLSRVRYTTARDHNVQKQIDLPDTVEAPKSSQVASEVEGLVAKIHAREGQYVKRGAPLVSLRAEHLEIELQASTAQKREADARLALADRNLTRSQCLFEMESSSSDSQGQIALTFPVGTDIDVALLRVSNRLQQVPSYPTNADKPVISSVGFAEGVVAWFLLTPSEENPYEGDISLLYDFVDDTIKPELERVAGIGQTNISGGRERELQVIVDPARLAARRVSYNELSAALERENRNFSGGDFDEGKRRYVVRTIGEYGSPEDVEDIVIAVRDGILIYLRDVGRVELGYRNPGAKVFHTGKQVIALNTIRETGSNVLVVIAGLKDKVARLNSDVLAPCGLQLTQAYGETEYVTSVISLVQQSLLVGGLLVLALLLLYLRSASTTFDIGVAIPISVVGTFLAMYAFGRTLNVVSLAGLAFVVGMIVDNSIVVLENIYRHRQMGKSLMTAAYEGTREVWGAVLASTLTTIAVFVLVIFIQEEVGQLFGDIAIAISCAVFLSLIVSMTVIPSLSARILRTAKASPEGGDPRRNAQNLWGLVRWASAFVKRVGATVAWIMATTTRRLAVVAFFTFIAVGGSWLLMPKTEYLPVGNNNFLFGVMIPPIMALNAEIPGTFVVVNQSSIFQRGFDEGRNIDINIAGPELPELMTLGQEIFGQVRQKLPGSQGRPVPGLTLDNPEIRVVTHRRRAAELGLSNRELGFAVSALIDGAKASDYHLDGREIEIRVMSDLSDTGAHRTHRLGELPIATPNGGIVTLDSVAELVEVNGPVQINHRERERAITLRITPAETMALEEAMDIVENGILVPMRADGRLGGLYQVNLSGTADKLSQTANTLKWNLVLAIVITYLLMAALFESFLHPFVIMFSVPLAGFGGMLGLFTVNLFTLQPLDVLTMLGFIILVGTVVNNAILIVHQSLNHMKVDEMEPHTAIREAVENRIRPIFMSVSTSVFGMLPLVIFPGAVAELYRGLGSVVVGGLVVSTVFTLFLVPALFSLTLNAKAGLTEAFRGFSRPAESAAD